MALEDLARGVQSVTAFQQAMRDLADRLATERETAPAEIAIDQPTTLKGATP